MTPFSAAVGDAERDALRFRRGRENRFREGRIDADVRRHHYHVVRLEVGILLKKREQLIVQHFHLPHWAVAGMELERAVMGRKRLRAGPARIVQLENIALNLCEPGLVSGGAEMFLLPHGVDRRDGIEKFAPGFA